MTRRRRNSSDALLRRLEKEANAGDKAAAHALSVEWFRRGISPSVEAVDFFYEWAGYATPPGKIKTALHLALAEAAAEKLQKRGEWDFEWRRDWDCGPLDASDLDDVPEDDPPEDERGEWWGLALWELHEDGVNRRLVDQLNCIDLPANRSQARRDMRLFEAEMAANNIILKEWP